ncbi:MAG: FMN-binding negative transcriptional regulator [Bacteroidetes bacterium]|nr:FMN-binding negative transcriptional regulator [Bacteroidota bacterium]
MYIPPHFQASDQGEALAFMRQFPFAALLTQHHGRLLASHLPFIIGEKDGQLWLRSHCARANPQAEGLDHQEVLVIFQEPHAYISPSHYSSKQQVPTWNYVAVHAYGVPRILRDPAEALTLIEASIQTFEPAYLEQWKGLSSTYRDGMLRGITAFEIPVSEWQAKDKLSQNKTEEERARIRESLAHATDPHGPWLAGRMQEK